jgi:hypothetical protein
LENPSSSGKCICKSKNIFICTIFRKMKNG